MKALVVDGTALSASLVCAALAGDGVEAEATGFAADVPAAVEARAPDVVVIDLSAARAAALEAIAAIMQRRPTPILVLTDGDADWDEARRLGALDCMPRATAALPGGPLRERLRWLARIPVVRHVRVREAKPTPVPLVPSLRPRCRVVGVAASAGGTAAVATLLAGLDASFAGCLAIVQHLPIGFAAPFAQLLREHGALPVTVVDRAIEPRPGSVLVAGDDRHLEARADGALVPSDAPPLGPHRPSATLLFSSLARVYGRDAVGVVLSGMGDDGARGLAELRERGALTIAQDEASAAVFGMPRAAIEAGAIARVLPLDQIAGALVEALR